MISFDLTNAPCTGRQWNISSDHEEFEYFMNFVATMANLTLSDFSALYDFEEDERLMNVNLTELVQYVSGNNEILPCIHLLMGTYCFMFQVHPSYKHVVRTFDEHVVYDRQRVITERGVCYTINAPLTLMLKKR